MSIKFENLFFSLNLKIEIENTILNSIKILFSNRQNNHSNPKILQENSLLKIIAII